MDTIPTTPPRDAQPWRLRLHRLVNTPEGPGAAYSYLMTLIIFASLLPLCFRESTLVLRVIEYVCTGIFVLDYLARWITADYKLGKGARSFVIYPFTPMAIVDLLTILPTFIALNDAFKTLRVLRLLRALRVFKLIRYSKSVKIIVDVVNKQKQSLVAVLCLALSYVLVCALIIFNAEPDTFGTFFDAVYWAVVSLTTVGYGDLYPVSLVGRTIAMVSSLMGVAIVALPAGIITAGILDELKEQTGE